MLFPFSGTLVFDEDLVSKPGIVIDAADPILPYHRIFYQVSLQISGQPVSIGITAKPRIPKSLSKTRSI
jgi:hypothetical protein